MKKEAARRFNDRETDSSTMGFSARRSLRGVDSRRLDYAGRLRGPPDIFRLDRPRLKLVSLWRNSC
jgi:hypothetical protein